MVCLRTEYILLLEMTMKKLFFIITFFLALPCMGMDGRLSKKELRQLEKESLQEKMRENPELGKKTFWSARLNEITEKEDKSEERTFGSLLGNDKRGRTRQEKKPPEDEEEEFQQQDEEENGVSAQEPGSGHSLAHTLQTLSTELQQTFNGLDGELQESLNRLPILDVERNLEVKQSDSEEEPESHEQSFKKNEKKPQQSRSFFSFAKLCSFSWWWSRTTHLFSARLLSYTFWKSSLFGSSNYQYVSAGSQSSGRGAEQMVSSISTRGCVSINQTNSGGTSSSTIMVDNRISSITQDSNSAGQVTVVGGGVIMLLLDQVLEVRGE